MFKKTIITSCLLAGGITNTMYRTIDLCDMLNLLSNFDDSTVNYNSINAFNRFTMNTKDTVLTVHVEVPGYEKEEVKVTLHNNGRILEVEAKQEDKKEEKESKEFTGRRFSLRRSLPYAVQEDSAKASLKNGILTVELKKAEQPERTIVIE